jgi:hypothetical protein
MAIDSTTNKVKGKNSDQLKEKSPKPTVNSKRNSKQIDINSNSQKGREE